MTATVSTPKSAAALKVWTTLFLFIALKAAGNLAMAWGMKHSTASPFFLALLDRFVILGILALILSIFVRMALLSFADLSYVLPVTAIGYVLAALLGRTFLHETVSPQRWAGTGLIFIGAALVGSTAHSTTPARSK